MDDRQSLRQTIVRFRSEVGRVLDGTFLNMPVPLERLLDALDCEPAISAYIGECTGTHLPEDFDAALEVDRVSRAADAVFGPYPTDVRAATGEVYLIVQELATRGAKCHDDVFQGYGFGSSRMSDIAHNFTEDVMVRLIDNVSEHLAQRASELGMGDEPTDGQAKATEVTPSDTGDAPLKSLDELLGQLMGAIAQLPGDVREDATLQAEALADELAEPNPKRRVVSVLLRGLRMMDGDRKATDAIDQLEDRLRDGGIL